MLLTWVSYWRGAGAALFPAGVWPRLLDYSEGPLFELGPVLSAQHQLLTDDQCLRLLRRLLCDGSPFRRPSEEAFLDSIDLDTHNSPARMCAILLASLFHEWREGTYACQCSGTTSQRRSCIHWKSRTSAVGSPTSAPRWPGSWRASAT